METKKTSKAMEELVAEKQAAKAKMRMLSDEDLTQVAGGGPGFKNCVNCNAWIAASYKKCPVCHEWAGDDRDDMIEANADIAGLMEDIDGFAE